MKKMIRIESGNHIYDIPEGAKYVAFDGCHKFYICENEDDLNLMKDTGYNKFVEIDELADAFNNTTCDLRFINTAQLDSVVPQFENAKFVFDDGSYLETSFYLEEEDEEEVE